MKFIHLSDLHIGKRLYETSLIEDQRFILKQIVRIAASEKPDGVIIAGDVYDKPVPSAEAVLTFDTFLTDLKALGTEVFVLSGNHDSAERIGFGSKLMNERFHLSPVYDGAVEPVTMTDAYGTLKVWMLPFLKPVHVRAAFPEEAEEIVSYTDAMRVAVSRLPLDPEDRNVLITHQFVTGALRSESEEVSVGGTDNVDASVFSGFDYVALGHIHGAQNCGSERIRYCGTPLKYSFSEANDEKSVTVAELGAKGAFTCRTVPLKPLRDMVRLKGTYDDLMMRKNYENTTLTEDYLSVTLTDEQDVSDAMAKLRNVYRNLLHLEYDNARTRAQRIVTGAENAETKTPLELFCELFAMQNGRSMSEAQIAFVTDLIETISEGR
ncbi:MAG: exonuclease SbcCD subunit D [Clostridia bacterium]|nr:exonuclease SbcCD subunit D [Clostridia bacterium]